MLIKDISVHFYNGASISGNASELAVILLNLEGNSDNPTSSDAWLSRLIGITLGNTSVQVRAIERVQQKPTNLAACELKANQKFVNTKWTVENSYGQSYVFEVCAFGEPHNTKLAFSFPYRNTEVIVPLILNVFRLLNIDFADEARSQFNIRDRLNLNEPRALINEAIAPINAMKADDPFSPEYDDIEPSFLAILSAPVETDVRLGIGALFVKRGYSSCASHILHPVRMQPQARQLLEQINASKAKLSGGLGSTSATTTIVDLADDANAQTAGPAIVPNLLRTRAADPTLLRTVAADNQSLRNALEHQPAPAQQAAANLPPKV